MGGWPSNFPPLIRKFGQELQDNNLIKTGSHKYNFQTDDVKRRFPLFYKVANYYRNKRFGLFQTLLNVKKDTPILDVGGEFEFWENMKFENIMLLNIHKKNENKNIKSIVYDGGKFPFKDKKFEVVFSNSTIEHVGDFRDQKLFASEIQRVGKLYFVQTPSFWFPYEPHAMIPFYQFLPSNIKMWLRTIYPKSTYPIEKLLSIRLLTKKELKYLFPSATIITERMFLFPKSYYAVKNK